jgi:pimeloyl-ACP methyl ester carboxylesterase
MNRRFATKSVLALLAGSLQSPARPANGTQRRGSPPGFPFIETHDRTRIRFRDWGTGRPIVFVAPWALCSDWWSYPITALAEKGWRCVAFDRRGHGRSDEPGRGYDCDTLADDLAAVLDTLDLQNVVLVGHSMGASEVVRYLTRHRSRRVASAVLVAPVTPFTLKTEDNPSGAPKEVLEKFRESLQRDLHRQAAQAAPDFFGKENHVSTKAMDWWARMIVDRCSIPVMSRLHKVMSETDFRPELRTITTPVLIVHGDRDQSAPLERTGRPTQRLIANSRLIVYEGAAHGLPFTHADRLLSDILAFAG